MKKIQIGEKINLYGTPSIIEKEQQIISNLPLTGNEYNDRILLQKCIDEHNLKSDILYEGNSVYPFKKIVKAYRKLQKTETLDGLTEDMYHFFINVCGDIAHYSINGFRDYYNNSFIKLENELLRNCWNTSRFSDRDRIFKELKIGREYFNQRELINLDEISLNKLKTIIKECGWDITTNRNYWTLKRSTICNTEFSFNVDVSANKVSDVVNQIEDFYYSFDKDIYVEDMVSKRDGNPLSPSIREIVSIADNVKLMLAKLNDNVVYKSRFAVEEKNSILNNSNENIILQNEDYDLDICG